MAAPIRKKVRFNYRDYLNIPGEKRYEIIEGDLHMVPAPITKHQAVSSNLNEILRTFVKERNLGVVLYAPVDVVFSEEDVVQPDLLFISQDRLNILKESNVDGAPDLIVEILSPATREIDRTVKKKLYERYGVKEYWLVDPEARTVEIQQMTDDGFRLFRTFPQGTHVKSPLLPGLSFLTDEIF